MSAQGNTPIWTFVAIQIGFAAVIIAAMVLVRRKQARLLEARRDMWQRFARENGLKFTAGPASFFNFGELSIAGRIAEHELEIATYSVRVGKSTQSWIRVVTRGPGPAGNFSLQPENFLTRAGALVGMGGLSLGDEEFDKQFLVKSAPESLAREVLDAALRKQLMGLIGSPKLNYADGSCELTWRAGTHSIEQLSAAVKTEALLFGAFRRTSRISAH